MLPSYAVSLGINIAVTAIYGALVLWDWWRQPRATRKAQLLNTWGVIAALIFAQYFLAGYFYNMSQATWGIPFDPLPVTFMLVVAVPGAIAVVLRVFRPKTPERAQYLRELLPLESDSLQTTIRRDLQRKGMHVILFGTIFAIDLIGFYILVAIFNPPVPLRTQLLETWGYGENLYIIFAWTWEGWLSPHGVINASRMIVIGFLYCLTLLFLTAELCRHSRRWGYIFEKAVYRTLRFREINRMGAYALFAAGFLLASLFLPYFGIMGLLAGWSLGDLAASQVGMRWGRHRIFQQDKTWEGLIAGAVTSFVAAISFLGLAWAGALSVTFMVIDLLTEKPIPISDNLLFPIFGTLVFIGLQAAGIAIAPVFIALA